MGKSDNYIGKCLGSYRLIKLLGKGSFGSVYLAQHIYLNRGMVAIKILDSKYLDTDEEREAFLNEARFLEMLKHRHILPIIDVGLQDDTLFMITEYAPKGSLRDRMLSQRPALLSMRETHLILSQIGYALEFAHRHNVVHRDLKPANILFNDRGDALLADFGVAIQLKSGTEDVDAIGTPQYMAPEQFNRKASLKTDQYALACIAYELFTGQTPLVPPQHFEWATWIHKVYTEEASPIRDLNPDVSESAEQAIRKALTKNYKDRHANVATFISSMMAQTSLLDLPELPTMIVSEEVLTRLQPISLQIKSLEQWLSEAEEHCKNLRWNEAKAAYEEIIKSGCQDSAVYYQLGYVFYQLKMYREALLIFEKATDLGFEDAIVYYYKGYILHLLGNLEDALVAYEQAIQRDQTRATFYSSKGTVLRDLKHYAEALDAFKQAISLSPNVPIFYINQGEVYLAIRAFKEASEAYESAIHLTKNDRLRAKAYVGKANALLRLRHHKDSIEAFDLALHFYPQIATATLFQAKGDAFWRNGQNDEALKAYERGLELEPGHEILQQKKEAMLNILGKQIT